MLTTNRSADLLVAQDTSGRFFMVQARVVVLLLATSSLAGCSSKSGPDRVAVAGTVSLDGEPIKTGCIRFIPTEATKGPAAVAIIQEGAYSLSNNDGPVAGILRVEIEATNFQDFELDDEEAYADRAAKGKPPLKKNPVPPIYNRNSTLTAQLTTDGNRTFDFPLSSKGRATPSR